MEQDCKTLTGHTAWSFVTPSLSQPEDKVVAKAIVAWIGWDSIEALKDLPEDTNQYELDCLVESVQEEIGEQLDDGGDLVVGGPHGPADYQLYPTLG